MKKVEYTCDCCGNPINEENGELEIDMHLPVIGSIDLCDSCMDKFEKLVVGFCKNRFPFSQLEDNDE